MVDSISSSFVILLLLGLVAAVAAFNKYDENALFVGQRIRSNEMLRWGRHRLILQADCLLILRGPNNLLIWQSNTQYRGNDCSLVMRRDGNLVLYGDTDNVVWESKTAGNLADYVCLLREDFNVVVYGAPIWHTRLHYPPIYITSSSSSSSLSSLSPSSSSSVRAPPPSNGRYDQNVLYEGERLSVNQELRTKFFRFAMQSDCNLVVYSTYTDMWKSNTEGKGVNCFLELQRDGNLVIFNDSASAVWESGTAAGDGGDYVLILQDDGNVFLYSKALWSIKPITTTTTAALTTNSTTLQSDIAMVTN